MSLVRDQADWIIRCGTAKLGDEQRVLLETVLVSSAPEAVLTRHVASAEPAVAALAQLHSALESRARPGRKKAQPYAKPTLGLVSAALKVIESMTPLLSPSALDETISALKTIKEGDVEAVKSSADCGTAAEELAARMAEVRTAVIERFAEVWRGEAAAADAERLGLEVAALSVMEGRWHPQLCDDVRTALSRGPVDADRLLEVLLPAERDFRVAVVIEGTSHLKALSGLIAPAAAPMEIRPGAPVTDWGRGMPDLKALVALVETTSEARCTWSKSQAGGYVLLTLIVHARDLGGAALLGRRLASETLDQYVAGQRIAEIRLRPETLAYEPVAGRVLRLAEPVLGTDPVQPLTTVWPPALRESLRTAHIARITEAPMAAAGLSWAALEALEVKPENTGTLARALSLQAIRQQLVDLHQQTRTAVAATAKAARDAHRTAKDRSAGLKAALAAAADEKTADLERKAQLACAAVLDRHATLERALDAEQHLVTVDVWTGVGGDAKLNDPSRWLDVLAAAEDANLELHAAGDALSALVDDLDGEVGARLRAWRVLTGSPKSLATWIENTAERFERSLNWLYALRNTALHDGRFTSATDTLDAHAGRAFVDLTLEFLGNWYTRAADASSERGAWTAIDVIDHLSERQKSVVAELQHGRRTSLNVSHLTSPTSTGLDRD